MSTQNKTSAYCTCRYWANQHGAGYSMCEMHGMVFRAMAKREGISADELFNRIVMDYCNRVLGATA